MKKLPNMVLIQETIGGGFLNEKGKAVVTTKTKTYARSKDWYEKNKSDETLKVLGDAYEKITIIQGRKVRQIVTLEKAEQIEGKKAIEPFRDSELKSELEKVNDDSESDNEPTKRGRKKAEQKEI